MDISEFSNKGELIVAEDLNSRTGIKPDYIENGFLLFTDGNYSYLDIFSG